MNRTARMLICTALPGGLAVAPGAFAQAPSGSLLVQAQAPGQAAAAAPASAQPHALRALSMFAVAPAQSRLFHAHDLIQIIVRETTQAASRHELDTEKDSRLRGEVNQWPDLQLANLLNGWVRAGPTDDLPQVDFRFRKDFKGQGDYNRRDDFTARLTAEVVQVLPNGNLILESRSRMKNDDEEFVLKVTGMCRSEDVTAANAIQSSQLHDLNIEKINSGELKKANQKGILSKVLDTFFAF
jgi:flagellar L-ring protein FlgH